MSQRWLPALLLALAACGGGQPAQAGPDESAKTPDAAVRSFMQAVADSNIARMGRYWGTSKGPATLVRQPADHQQRLVITQAYLRKSPYRLIRTDPVSGDASRMTVLVEIDRTDPDGGTCVRSLPFGTVNTGRYGWIVNSIDLNLAGSPVRPCSNPRAG